MKKILIIGATSKVAQRLISEIKNNYDLVLASRTEERVSDTTTLPLNLSSVTSIESFIERCHKTRFSAVFVFSSTYKPDELSPGGFLSETFSDFSTNVIGPVLVLKNLVYEKGARVFLFGDAGLSNPKSNYSSYSMSKALLRQSLKSLAVELAPKNVSVLEFALGPTLPHEDTTERKKAYRDRNLLRVDDPVDGLIKLCIFIIQTPNVNMTGSTIRYDGGTYLKRHK